MTIKPGMSMNEMTSILTGEEEANAAYCLRRWEAACEEPMPDTLPERTLRSAELADVSPVSRNSSR